MSLEDKGSQRLLRKLADPDHARRVAEIRQSMQELDRDAALAAERGEHSDPEHHRP